MNRKYALVITAGAAALIAAGTSGCMNQPHHDRALKGDSVDAITLAQTLDQQAATRNGTDILSQLDGQTGENVLHTYRKHTGKPENVQQAVQISIGGSN